MRNLGRLEEKDAFNSNLASLVKRPRLPDWFPRPHAIHRALDMHLSDTNLKNFETARCTWTPPFEIFLTGNNSKTASSRWSFAVMYRAAMFERAALALTDPAVRPLPKREWRNITCGAEFKHCWPSDVPFNEDHPWRMGLDKLFGTAATARAQEGVRKKDFDSVREVLPEELDCECDTLDHIDWESDIELMVSIAYNYAEVALLYELALIDPDLTYDLGEPYGRVNYPLLGHLPDQLASNAVFMEKHTLVNTIVWYAGVEEPRGWEQEYFMDCRHWVLLLSRYLEPLWREDEKLKEKKIILRTVEQVKEESVMSLEETDMSELDAIRLSLLVFWATVLQRDFGIIHTPFFPSPNYRIEHFQCAAHRGAE